MTAPRPYTPEEVRDQLLDYVRGIAQYWAELPDKTPLERCNGLAFSMLNIFDGTSAALPAMDISLAPHPDDQAYRAKHSENWYEPGQVINACYLHDLYYRRDAETEADGG